MSKTAFAVGCHPDDIEFVMSGTLVRLRDAGYNIHYMNVANGCCGSDSMDAAETIEVRRSEAMNAAALIGAEYHESVANDLEVFYNKPLLAKIGAVMRKVEPDILLTHYPFEYMEDHSNTCRLAVSAAFTRGMRNFPTDPQTPPTSKQVVVYHAIPLGLRDPLRRPVPADIYIDVTDIIPLKREILSKHKSQKEWLDISQGMDSYLREMEAHCESVGGLSGTYKYAEGWIRHLSQGYCDADSDPLTDLFA